MRRIADLIDTFLNQKHAMCGLPFKNCDIYATNLLRR
jgi:hypothetical protein